MKLSTECSIIYPKIRWWKHNEKILTAWISECVLPLDTSTSADDCEHHIRQWRHMCQYCKRRRTCTVDTFVLSRNRSRNHIRVGNRKTVNRCNQVDRCIPAHRWQLRIWYSGRKDWGNTVLLYRVQVLYTN